MKPVRVVVGVVSIALLCVACESGGGDPAPARDAQSRSVPTATESAPAADPDYIVRRITVGRQPCAVVGAAGKVWVSLYDENSLISIDPRTGEVGKPTPVGTSPCGLAYGAGSIWVENYGSYDVTRVDAASGRVQDTIAVGGAPYDVTFAAGSAWVTNYIDGTVSRIEATTGEATTIKVGGTPIGIAPTPGAVWIAVGMPGLVKIDADSAKVVDRVDVGGTAGWTAYHDASLWVGVDASEVEVDGRTGKLLRRVDVGPRPLDGDVLDGVVWVPDGSAGKLYLIDLASGETLGEVASGVVNPFVVAGYRGRLWAVDYAGTDVVAIDPHGVLP